MLQRLAEIEIEFRDVEARLADPALLQNQEHYVDLTRRHRELASIVDRYHQLLKAIDDRDTAREMIAEVSGEEKEMLREELATADATISGLEDELKVLLLPRDPNDDKNVIVEIRGAEGGEEANLFARDLFEMYKAYAARMGWQFEFLGANPSDMGGFSEVTFLLVGKGI